MDQALEEKSAAPRISLYSAIDTTRLFPFRGLKRRVLLKLCRTIDAEEVELRLPANTPL